MSDKVKVENKNNYSVMLIFSNEVVRELRPHSAVSIPKEEFEYIATTSNLLRDKHITVVDEEIIEEMGLDSEEVKFIEDEEILEMLKSKSINKFKEFIDSVDTIPLRNRVRDIAANTDLAASKVKYINETFGVDI